MDDPLYWKRHARRHEKKLRRLQSAVHNALATLDELADQLEEALGARNDRS